jgi:hypothetical protein
MSEKPLLCQHCIAQNITKSVAGRKIHRDQCVKCYDDSVRLIIYKYNYIIKEMFKRFRYMLKMF